jgi:sec-independent protein translocase protein TatA
MFGVSPVQIIFVLVIVLLLFGAKRLPEMGRSLGRTMREFKSSVSGDEPSIVQETLAADAGEIAARQAPPAPTPEIAEAELADARRAAANRTSNASRDDGPLLN